MDWSFLNTYPIYFVSSHGEYQLGERLHKEKEPAGFVIPPNVYVFEMSVAGEWCSADFDKLTWELCQGLNRKDFINYFLKRDGRNVRKRNLFDNLTFYKPGDYIYTRYLNMGELIRPTRMVDPAYKSFGFYKFNVDDPKFTYGDANGTMQLFANLFKRLQEDLTKFTSTEEVINKVIQEDKGWSFNFPGGIFFISSCGVTGCDAQSTKCLRRAETIAQHQRNQHLDLMSMGVTNQSRPRPMVFKGDPNVVPERYYEGTNSATGFNNDEERAWLRLAARPQRSKVQAVEEAPAAVRQPRGFFRNCIGWMCGRGYKGGKSSRKMRRHSRHLTRKIRKN